MSFAIGATVIKTDAYGKVSADDQKLIGRITKGMSKALRKQIRKDNESARKQMLKKGVRITETPADMLAQFDQAAKDVWAQLTGKMFSKAEIEMVIKYRDEFRAKGSGGGAAAGAATP
jgi:TRAP-type C4-dicarboxylate transport system substrate-binding protein